MTGGDGEFLPSVSNHSLASQTGNGHGYASRWTIFLRDFLPFPITCLQPCHENTAADPELLPHWLGSLAATGKGCGVLAWSMQAGFARKCGSPCFKMTIRSPTRRGLGIRFRAKLEGGGLILARPLPSLHARNIIFNSVGNALQPSPPSSSPSCLALTLCRCSGHHVHELNHSPSQNPGKLPNPTPAIGRVCGKEHLAAE